MRKAVNSNARALDLKRLWLIISMLASCGPKQAVATSSSSAFGPAFTDPGWIYRAVTGTLVEEDGGRYDITNPTHGALRAYASDFTTDLSVEVDISGFSSPPSQNAIVSMAVMDGWGRPLPKREHPRPVNRCRLGGRAGWGFPAGSNVCTIAGDFRILDFGASNDRISIVVNGLMAPPIRR